MQKVVEKENMLVTRISASPDGSRTYSLTKTIKGLEGGKGIFVLLYPTRTIENLHVEDSTNVHLLNHMKELGLSEYIIVNLFSTVTQSKLSTRGIVLDNDNLSFVKDKIFKELNTSEDKVIIAWGNSHQTSKVVNQAKLEILKMWEEMYGDTKLYQLTADSLDKDNVGVHPLYMGIRYSNATWRLEHYPTKDVMAKLEEARKGIEPEVKVEPIPKLQVVGEKNSDNTKKKGSQRGKRQ